MKQKCILLIIAFGFICLTQTASAQIGLSVAKTHPRGDFGKVFESATLVELSYNLFQLDEQFRLLFSIGYMRLHTTQDRYKIYGTVSGGNGTKVGSGYELYEDYFSIPLSLKANYRFLKTDLSPTAGFAAYVFNNSYYYESSVSIIGSETSESNNRYYGYHANIGLNYLFNKQFNLDLEFGRTATHESGDGKFIFWKTGLRINYNFK